MFYRILEKFAYSKIGKKIATKLRDAKYPNERIHWVQQRMADMHFAPAKPFGWK